MNNIQTQLNKIKILETNLTDKDMIAKFTSEIMEKGNFNRYAVKTLLNKNFCCREMMKLMFNLVQSIFLFNSRKSLLSVPYDPVELDVGINKWITEMKLLSDKSVEGITLTGGIKYVDNVFVIKFPKNKQLIDNLFHEYFIGLLLNTLRSNIPNFMYVYGMFRCNSSDVLCKNQITNPQNDTKFLVFEKINEQSLPDIISRISFKELIEIIIQLFFALAFANDVFEYCHLDLHAQNVLIKHFTVPQIVKYPYKDKFLYVTTRNIPIIIDYGTSRVKNNLGRFDTIGNSVIDNKQNAPEQDIYKFFSYMFSTFRNVETSTKKQFIDFFKNMFVNKFSNKKNEEFINDNYQQVHKTYYYITEPETKFKNIPYDSVLKYIYNESREVWDSIVSSEETKGYSKCECLEGSKLLSNLTIKDSCMMSFIENKDEIKDVYGIKRDGFECARYYFDGLFNIIELDKNYPLYHGSINLAFANSEFPAGIDYYKPFSEIENKMSDETQEELLKKRGVPDISFFGSITTARRYSSIPTKINGQTVSCKDNCVFSYKLIKECKFINMFDPFNIKVLINTLPLKEQFLFAVYNRGKFMLAGNRIFFDPVTDSNGEISKILKGIDDENPEILDLVQAGISEFNSRLVDLQLDIEHGMNISNDPVQHLQQAYHAMRRFIGKDLEKNSMRFPSYMLPKSLMKIFEQHGYDGYINLKSPHSDGHVRFSEVVFGSKIFDCVKRNYFDENDWQYRDRTSLFGNIGKLIMDMRKYKTTNVNNHEGDLLEHSIWTALYLQRILISREDIQDGIPESDWNELIITAFLHDIGKAGDKVTSYYSKPSHPSDGAKMLMGQKRYITINDENINLDNVLREVNLIDKKQEISCLIRGHWDFGDCLRRIKSERDVDEATTIYISTINKYMKEFGLDYDKENTLLFFNKQIIISFSDILGANSYKDDEKFLEIMKNIDTSLPKKFNYYIEKFPFISNMSKNHRGATNLYQTYNYHTIGKILRNSILEHINDQMVMLD
jgi:hypothetical protein